MPIPAFQAARRDIRKFVDSYGGADSCLLQAGVIRYLHEVKS